MAKIAVYDACVLYPAPVRDLLMHLALAELVAARWTDAIHDEWTRNVLSDRSDIAPSQLSRTRRLMDAHIPEALVTGYEHLIPKIILPDPDDRHVLAAAIRAGADAIVTFNLKDFPKAVLQSLGMEAIHPDRLLAELIAETPLAVCEAVKRQRLLLKKPPQSVADLLATLHQNRMVRSVELLAEFAELL